MKKLLAIVLALVMVMTVFAACTPKKPGPVSSDVIDTPSDDWSEEDWGEDDWVEEDWVEEDFGEEDVEDPNANISPVQLRANNIQLGEDMEYIQSGIIRDKNGKVKANNYRLKQFINKMNSGKNIKVCFFGGQNVGIEGGYSDRFISWLEPEANGYVTSYEASFPGIISDAAIFRTKHDVIDQNPDLVFLDFTVQDAFGGGAKNRAPIFENMVRKILAESDAAVVIISNVAAEINSYRQNNSNPDPMTTAAEYHKAIAEYYGVPFIDFHNATWDIVSLLVDKKPYGQIPVCSWPIFGQTNTDLTDVGHKNLSEMMKALILAVKDEKTTDKAVTLGKTSDANTYLYKNNSYMTYDYIDAMDLYLGTNLRTGSSSSLPSQIAGYSLAYLERDKNKAAYSQWSKYGDYNGSNQFFQAFRPLLSSATADTLISAPIVIDMPKVTKENKAFLHVAYEQTTGGKQTIPFSLVRYTCYDENGKIIGGEGKRYSSPALWKETPTNWAYDGYRIELREGTVRVEFEIYAGSGYIRLYGVGRTQTINGKIPDSEIY